MYQTIEVKVKGVCPMLQHNGQMADPLNPITKEMKKVSSKRKKTDEDFADMAKIEWTGGLYLDEKGRVGVPGECIEAMFLAAAKSLRLGKQAQCGILSDGFWLLEYDGPKNVEALWADGRFRDMRGVRIQRNRIIRCRPIFRNWGLTFKVSYEPTQIDKAQVLEIVQIAGRTVGIGDYRPKYGRFEIE